MKALDAQISSLSSYLVVFYIVLSHAAFQYSECKVELPNFHQLGKRPWSCDSAGGRRNASSHSSNKKNQDGSIKGEPFHSGPNPAAHSPDAQKSGLAESAGRKLRDGD